MLNIIGPPVTKKVYVRIPMHDGLGNVSAFIHERYVTYRPIGVEHAEARARLIASELGGSYQSYWHKGSQRWVHIAVVDFD